MKQFGYEQIKPADTPDDMRAEIYRVSYGDSMVRNVMMMSDHMGLSGEDRYVILAYNALRELNRLKQLVLDDKLMNPAPHFVFVDKEQRALRNNVCNSWFVI